MPGGAARTTITRESRATVAIAARELVKELLKLAGNDSPSAGLGADEVGGLDGGLCALEDASRRESYASILSRARREEVTTEAETPMPLELGHWSMHSHSALFCGVRVNSVTGEIRVSQFLGSFDCGRILNAKTAASQFRCGIIMGLGLALMEEVMFDERSGRIMNPSLAEYHVPVHLDAPNIDAICTDERDLTPLLARAASVRSALRGSAPRSPTLCSTPLPSARDLPITLDNVMSMGSASGGRPATLNWTMPGRNE
jgi:xanthine dehydrogenase YagR molybdenum-binding subunit